MRALPVLLICLASWVALACSSAPQLGEPVTKTAEQPLALPAGFAEEDIGGTWNQAVGLTFAADGHLYVWEKAGRVWRVHQDGERELFLDIRPEVATRGDFGLLGFALHPNFLANGYFYLLYAADHYYLTHASSPDYDPNASDDNDTIVRIVRYQARPEDGFETVDLTSRKVLMGETPSGGCPLLHLSHGVGSLVFGTDGSLLASCGDGSSYIGVDAGGPNGGSHTALTDGIIRPAEDVGAFRSQMVNSLSGKILRLDPNTGDGLSSNPFYNPAAPRSAASRVWALGFRNPYRFTIRPETGSHNPNDGRPGTLYVGDVGWNTYEEIDIVSGPGQNFGWPLYEGLDKNSPYYNVAPFNQDAPNPLNGTGGCQQASFPFSALVVQDSLNTPSFPNPCNASQQVPASVRTFKHRRPVIEWQRVGTRLPTYDASGNATATAAPADQQFGGTCSVGGTWYEGDDFPSTYKNTYFHADYTDGWIRNFVFDDNDKLIAVRPFVPPTPATPLVSLVTDPTDGGLYYIKYENTVRRIRYVGSGNQKPVPVLEASTQYGPGPLSVQFTGDHSHDPELGALTYSWNFGDGSAVSTAANPLHVFNPGVATPIAFDVTLTVTDIQGAAASETLTIAVNDTPPTVEITSPVDSSLLSSNSTTTVQLSALVEDAEQAPGELTCVWKPILHHNQHTHPQADIEGCTGNVAQLPSVPCGEEFYYYEIKLTVSDGLGLSTVKSVNVYPSCAPILLAPQDETVSTRPTYVWIPSPGADQYRLRVHQGAAIPVDTIQSADALGCSTPPTSCSATPAISLALGAASFEVQGHTLEGWGDWSEAANFTVANLGTGLRGEYFANADLAGSPAFVRMDPLINFNWGTASPGPNVPTDHFSVRWTGVITPQISGVYTLQTEGDDGVRLYLNGQLVIDDWHNHALTTNLHTTSLVAGQQYSVRMEFYDNLGDGIARLNWAPPGDSGAGAAFQPIDTSVLFPPAGLPPVANAGPDQAAASGATVSLNGGGSTDPNGSVLTYAWTQIGGPAVTLTTSSSNPVATFTAPSVSSATTLTFQLVVSAGTLSSTDTVVITAQPPGTVGTGLKGEYFSNLTLSGTPVLTRTDATVNFTWPSAPATGVSADNFSVRWTGSVQATVSGTYTFTTQSDDGVRLWINGVNLVENWTNHGPTPNAGTITLTAGQQYSVRMEFYDAASSALAQLMWTPPGGASQIIPQAQLYPAAAPPPVPQPPVANAGADQAVTSSAPVTLSGAGSSDPNGDALTYAWTQTAGQAVTLTTSPTNPVATFTAPSVTSATSLTFQLVVSDGALTSTDSVIVTVQPPGTVGTGLKGEYFTNISLSGTPALTRTDATVDFLWPDVPGPGFPVDNWSVRWTGSVQATVSGTYTFSTQSDDGVRLWINGVNLVENWTNHGTITNSGTITLSAGQQYSVRMEFYEAAKDAVARLLWTPPGGTSQVIPTARLFLPVVTPQPPVADAGADQAVPSGTVVTLSGAGSSDPNGDALTYTWTQTAGQTVTLTTSPSNPAATFTAPSVTGATALTFQLAVSDGTSSATDSIVVTVQPPGTVGTGLKGEYFSNLTLSGTPVLTRTDATVNFTWPSAPATGVSADNFSVRWTGSVQATVSGTYTFSTQSDDGVRLWINGVNLVENWTNHGPTTNGGTITLAAGQQYSVRMEFYDAASSALAQLMWTPPGGASQIIPQAQLYAAVAPPPDPQPPVANAGADQAVPSSTLVTLSGAASSDPNGDTLTYAWTQIGGQVVTLTTSPTNPVATFTAPSVTSATSLTFQLVVSDGALTSTDSVIVTVQPPGTVGTGLKGEYFTNISLSGTPALTRTDATVDFLWPDVPGPGFPVDNWSVRWTGSVQATVSGSYTFSTQSDDGVRLWINGVNLVENWTNHGTTTNSGTITLSAGQQYSVRMEFYEAAKDAVARLLWTPPGGTSQVIPTARLFLPVVTPQPPVADAGADQAVPSSTVVTLSGAGSSDPNGDALTYTWTQIGGQVVTLTTSTSNPAATFTAPSVTSATALTFQLAVSDGTSSATDSIVVTVQPPGTVGTGLKGEYFGNLTLSGAPALTRTDATVNFTWADAPASGLPADNFSVRWTGTVQTTVAGTYTFATQSDDGVRLWINGVNLVDNWTNHGAITNGGTITLNAGQQYSVRMEFYEATGGAVAQLLWTPPGGSSQVIPSARLYLPVVAPQPPVSDAGLDQGAVSNAGVTLNGAGSTDPNGDVLTYTWTQIGGQVVSLTTSPSSPLATFTAPTVATATTLTFQLAVSDGTSSSTDSMLVTVLPPGSVGTGLKGEYFSNLTLSGTPALTRTDTTVNFTWPDVPAPGLPIDNFSVRWTGSVQATVSGSYTFSTQSDDGVRLWINGVNLVENWTNHGPTTNVGTITLTAGQQYTVRMEFYEAGGSALAQLLWTPPGGTSQVIPQARLATP